MTTEAEERQTGQQVEVIGGVAIYHIKHERLFREADLTEVRIALDELVEKTDGIKLAIDFANVEALSSQMLGILVALRKSVKAKRGSMALFGLNLKITQLFEVTRMASLFIIAPDEDTALSELIENKGLLAKIRDRLK